MKHWLLKTEPSDFSFEDLTARGVEPWDGVTSPFALKNLRSMEVADACVIYHTGGERTAVGLAHVVKPAYPDPKREDDRLVVVDVAVDRRLGRPVSLREIKADPRFVDSPLVRQGRLSVVPLTAAQYQALAAWDGSPG